MISTMNTSAARLASLALALAGASLLAACVPVLVGGAVAGGTMVAVDRRSAGTQVEDQTIEVRGASAASALLGDRGNVSVTSYGRMALLTGEVPTAADKAAVEKAVAQVANVRSTVNDLAVMPASSMTTRANDSIITGKVKAQFVDTSDLQVNSIKVVTERGIVYLMGRVTETEAKRATEVARSVGGVQKVVRVFEILTPSEVAAVQASVGAASQPAAKP